MFSCFSSLPPELRLKIWHDALPDDDAPALFFYRHIEPADPLDPHRPRGIKDLVIKTYLLDFVKVGVPLLSVNHEAHAVALAWTKGRGFEQRPQPRTAQSTLVRVCNVERDVLYISPDRWVDFVLEPHQGLWYYDYIDMSYCGFAYMRSFAVPEALFWENAAAIPVTLRNYPWLETLNVVLNAPDDLHMEENETKVQRRWELESTGERSMLWCGAQTKRYEWKDSDSAVHHDWDKRMADANSRIPANRRTHRLNIEIRPVIAVRR